MTKQVYKQICEYIREAAHEASVAISGTILIPPACKAIGRAARKYSRPPVYEAFPGRGAAPVRVDVDFVRVDSVSDIVTMGLRPEIL